MHPVLASQIARCKLDDDSMDWDRLLDFVARAYGEFDRQRTRNARENALMFAEVEAAQARQEESHACLKREHDKLEAALENMAHGLAMFDAGGRLVTCNSHYRLAIGMPDIAAGARAWDILTHVKKHCLANDPMFYEIFAELTQGNSVERSIRLKSDRIVSATYRPLATGGWVEVYRDVTEQHLADAQIRYLASHDSLTGLSNRVVINETVDSELSHLIDSQTLGVLCLDLDHFKAVNDTLGHPIGDKLLQQVAGRLKEAAAGAHAIGRLGGDEFAVLRIGPADVIALERFAERIVEELSAPYLVEGHQLVIGVSIGAAVAPFDGANAEELMRNADIALYRAKNDGRGGFRFFEPGMDLAIQARRQFEMDLRAAMDKNEFELHYQPLVDLKGYRIDAFEALLRWRRADSEMVAPDAFIPVAEEIGLIGAIGAWVLRKACEEAQHWPDDICVAVNVSPLQFSDRQLISDVSQALAVSGLPAHRLELEVTESVLLSNTEHTLGILHRLRELGVRIAMDDFGTGYSSLSYLRRFPFDKLKIDRSFIKDMTETQEAGAIVHAILRIANTLGMTTTAEGVENSEQQEFLRALNCTQAQGFYFSRPMSADQIGRLLQGEKTQVA